MTTILRKLVIVCIFLIGFHFHVKFCSGHVIRADNVKLDRPENRTYYYPNNVQLIGEEIMTTEKIDGRIPHPNDPGEPGGSNEERFSLRGSGHPKAKCIVSGSVNADGSFVNVSVNPQMISLINHKYSEIPMTFQNDSSKNVQLLLEKIIAENIRERIPHPNDPGEPGDSNAETFFAPGSGHLEAKSMGFESPNGGSFMNVSADPRMKLLLNRYPEIAGIFHNNSSRDDQLLQGEMALEKIVGGIPHPNDAGKLGDLNTEMFFTPGSGHPEAKSIVFESPNSGSPINVAADPRMKLLLNRYPEIAGIFHNNSSRDDQLLQGEMALEKIVGGIPHPNDAGKLGDLNTEMFFTPGSGHPEAKSIVFESPNSGSPINVAADPRMKLLLSRYPEIAGIFHNNSSRDEQLLQGEMALEKIVGGIPHPNDAGKLGDLNTEMFFTPGSGHPEAKSIVFESPNSGSPINVAADPRMKLLLSRYPEIAGIFHNNSSRDEQLLQEEMALEKIGGWIPHPDDPVDPTFGTANAGSFSNVSVDPRLMLSFTNQYSKIPTIFQNNSNRNIQLLEEGRTPKDIGGRIPHLNELGDSSNVETSPLLGLDHPDTKSIIFGSSMNMTTDPRMKLLLNGYPEIANIFQNNSSRDDQLLQGELALEKIEGRIPHLDGSGGPTESNVETFSLPGTGRYEGKSVVCRVVN